VYVDEKIAVRLRGLIKAAEALSVGNDIGHVRSDEHMSDCKGWLAAAANVVELACGDSSFAYKEQFQMVLKTRYGFALQRGVGDGAAILEALLQDMANGLLVSVADKARAETFDNFLDHAKAYHKEGAKCEAGVIAGVVFEDSIRRVCEKKKITQPDVKLDELISQLAKQNVFSQTKAKRARVSAHVRTKATHAQWDEFDLADVSVTIDFTDELIVNHIDK
jgi:hypothetical protein